MPVSAEWAALLRQIPDYDPIATCGDCVFDKVQAQLAIDFFHENLVFIEGETAGERFLLQPWQQAIVANLFGWRRPDGTRRYRKAAIFVARKNGKTPFTAGIIAYLAFCDGEPGAQLYSAAAEREQASLVYRHASGMVARNPSLQAHCKVHRSFKSIEFYPGEICMATYRALSADAETKHGLNCHAYVVDELHAQPNRDLVDVLETSMGSRRQPLAIYITTMGFNKQTICGEVYDYACKVRDGQVDDCYYLPVIYETKAEDDWRDPEVWAKANPNLGVSVKLEFLQAECKKAESTPAYENTFRRLYLNQWTESETRWISPDKWDACEVSFTRDDLTGKECWAGLDLSTTTDLSCLSLVFPVGDSVRVLLWSWMARDRAKEREDRDRVPYLEWARHGHLELTDGNVVDYGVIRRRINELGKIYKFHDIGVDRWNATQLILELGADGFIVAPFGQGYRDMSGPTKELEKLILGRTIEQNGNPILKWAMRNVMVEQDPAGNIKPSKSKSTERIDPVVATVMAVGRWQARPVEAPSIYESRGFISL